MDSLRNFIQRISEKDDSLNNSTLIQDSSEPDRPSEDLF